MIARRRTAARRAASAVEYALLVVGIMLCAAGVFRLLGKSAGKGVKSASDDMVVTDRPESAPAAPGGFANAGPNTNANGGEPATRGGGGGRAGVGGQTTMAEKVEVGGLGGPTSRGGKGAQSAKNTSLDDEDTRSLSSADDFGLRRGFGIGLLVLGLGSLAYVALKTRGSAKDAKDGDKGKGSGALPPGPAV